LAFLRKIENLTHEVTPTLKLAADAALELSGTDPCTLLMKAVEEQLASAKGMLAETLADANRRLEEKLIGDGDSSLIEALKKSVETELRARLPNIRLAARAAGRATWASLERSLNTAAQEQMPSIVEGVQAVEHVIERLDDIVEEGPAVLEVRVSSPRLDHIFSTNITIPHIFPLRRSNGSTPNCRRWRMRLTSSLVPHRFRL
jgi:hypothetical protein